MASPTIAILPWGDHIEDYLDPIGLSLEQFAVEMEGGWLFGTVDALACQGVEAVIVCVSGAVPAVRTFRHPGTGRRTVFIPASRWSKSVRARMRDPYGWTVADAVGPVRGARRWGWRLLRPLVPYLATPIRPLLRSLRTLDPRAILCQEYESPRFDQCVVAGRLLGVPVLGHFQGGAWQRSRLEAALRPMTLRASAGVVVGSARERERIRERYGLEGTRVTAIPNPLDPARWGRGDRPGTREALGVPDDARVVVWHGRVEIDRKGLDVLAHAWDAVRARRAGRDWRLLLVGDGPGRAALDTLLPEGPDRGVHRIREFVLDPVRMDDLLSVGDVYAFPSRHEGFAVAPAEAMACGLPVVAADAPGVADLFGTGDASAGLRVPVGDPGGLADALVRLLADPDLATRMGRAGRARVEATLAPDVVGRRLVDALRRAGADLARPR